MRTLILTAAIQVSLPALEALGSIGKELWLVLHFPPQIAAAAILAVFR